MTDAPSSTIRPRRRDTVLAVVDVVATFVFALEGALSAIAHRLDVFGVLVLAVATSTAGGIVRDLLIGDVPPASIRHRRYFSAAIGAAALAMLFHQIVDAIPVWLITGLDSAGLSLFAVAGTAKALDFGLSSMMAAVMGTITAVGGGTVRDLLLSRVPAILRVDIYAAAALVGSTLMVLGVMIGVRRWIAMIVGGAVCFAARTMSVANDWNLPVP